MEMKPSDEHGMSTTIQIRRHGNYREIEWVPDQHGQVRLGVAQLKCVIDAITTCEEDHECRALVFCSASVTEYCSGMDLEVIASGVHPTLSDVSLFATLLLKIRFSRLVTFARVEGRALGGGVGLAAVCDRVLCTSNAVFSLPESAMGLTPAMVLPVLYERLRPSQARWLALSGESQNADAALRIGLVDVVLPDKTALDRAVRQELRGILRRCPDSLRQIAQGLKARDSSSESVRIFNDALHGGARETWENIESGRVEEALQAFARGDLPSWCKKL